MMEGIEQVLIKERPDYVLVYGDADSTLAGAVTAAKRHIPVAHVEAGLRSFNRFMPEEINRILTDHSSQLLFTPTQTATDNLKKEGILGERVIQVGDVMLDAALFYQDKAMPVSGLPCQKDFILCTLHRAENTNDIKQLTQILEALNQLARTYQIIIPVHPRTRNLLALTHVDTSRLTLIEPIGYLSMVWLLKHCALVLTDSGGLQKEAFFFGKFCITLRDETEWVELLEIGVNRLSGANTETIINLTHQYYNSPVSNQNQLYGGGLAGERIIKALLSQA
jgi:UDP-GlcNAc3NAcA epimerase